MRRATFTVTVAIGVASCLVHSAVAQRFRPSVAGARAFPGSVASRGGIARFGPRALSPPPSPAANLPTTHDAASWRMAPQFPETRLVKPGAIETHGTSQLMRPRRSWSDDRQRQSRSAWSSGRATARNPASQAHHRDTWVDERGHFNPPASRYAQNKPQRMETAAERLSRETAAERMNHSQDLQGSIQRRQRISTASPDAAPAGRPASVRPLATRPHETIEPWRSRVSRNPPSGTTPATARSRFPDHDARLARHGLRNVAAKAPVQRTTDHLPGRSLFETPEAPKPATSWRDSIRRLWPF